MRYVFLRKHCIAMLFFMYFSCQLNAQRQNITFFTSRAIAITQLDKGLYFARNLTETRLGFSSSTSKRTLHIKPYGSRFFTENQIGSDHSIFVSFNRKTLDKLYKKYTRIADNISIGRDIFNVVDNRIKGNFRDRNLDNDFDSQLEEYTYRILSFIGSVAAKGAQKSYSRKARFYNDLLAATDYSNEGNNGKLTVAPVDLEFVTKNSDFEHNHKELLNFGIGSSAIAPGDNWLPRTSYSIYLGRRLWKGFKWSQRTCSALFVFAAHNSDGYAIDNKDENFFLGSDYIENPTQDFYPLIPNERFVIRNNQFSAGLIFRTYAYGSINVDIGVGYRFREQFNLIFDRGLDRFTENVSLSNNKFKNVIEYEGLPIYGMVSIGKTLGFNGGKPKFRLFLTSRFWEREFLPKDEFQVFEQNGNTFSKISITNEKQLFFTLSLGLGFHFN